MSLTPSIFKISSRACCIFVVSSVSMLAFMSTAMVLSCWSSDCLAVVFALMSIPAKNAHAKVMPISRARKSFHERYTCLKA